MLLYRGADTDATLTSIVALGGKSVTRRVLNDTFEIAALTIAGDRIQAAANIPGGYSISLQPTDGGLRSEMSNQVNVNNVDGSNLAFPG